MTDLNFQKHLSQQISKYFDEKHDIISISAVNGGSINSCFQLKTNRADYFIKINDVKKFPEMFHKEQKGLELLGPKSSFRLPKVLLNGTFESNAYLITEFIHVGRQTNHFWELFGKLLAGLHQNTADYFGLDHNNYIGSLTQHNEHKTSWADFFVENRLIIQQKMARDSKKIDPYLSTMLDQLYPKMENLFPKEKSSLLHGDLWSGNFMMDERGEPTIFDPAVYYGHREMDIAMSRLFGGFDEVMYNSYNQHFPLEKGWEERLDLCNLYPLLVHANLFGGGYSIQIGEILKKFLR